jgi:hypothetical protein
MSQIAAREEKFYDQHLLDVSSLSLKEFMADAVWVHLRTLIIIMYTKRARNKGTREPQKKRKELTTRGQTQ